MAQHYVHDRARFSGVRFASKQDGLKASVRIYVCQACGLWHYGKQDSCSADNCGGKLQHFASKAEARRFAQLRMLLACGMIKNLELQPRYPVTVNGVLICTYIGDFRYVKDGEIVIEDTKGSAKYSDGASALRRKLAEVLYRIKVTIVEH